MRYFPAFFDLKDRPVFVVGGGETAMRKLRLLLKASPQMIVFSAPKGSPISKAFGDGVTVLERGLASADFADRPALVVAAQDDEAADRAVAALANAHFVPVNVVDQPAFCDVVIPSIIDRGDLGIGISTGGAAPVIGRRLRERIESILPARLGELVAFAGARRGKVAAQVPHAARRGFWERILSGQVAEAVLDGDMAVANDAFDCALGATDALVGAIHIVGAGPGDPELLTLKALRVLQEADIVLYDNLVSDDVLDLIRRDAERQYVGKRRADHSMPQGEIGKLIIHHAKAGKRVVRLKGGDPYIFGRGGEEVDVIEAAGLSVKVIPGITAAAGCAATASMPLTHRGLAQAVTYVTAQAGGGGAPDIDWAALAQLNQTIVIYMGVGRAKNVAESLVDSGMAASTPAAIIEKGTLPQQRIVRTRVSDLGTSVAAAGISGPAILVVGAVAARANGRGLLDLIEHTAEAA